MNANEGIVAGGAMPSFPPASVTPVGGGGFLALLDNLLRRREDFFTQIFEGTDLKKLIGSFFLIILTSSAAYGMTMGASGFTVGMQRGALQMLSSGLKVPALYLLTLLVCYPVLFIILVLMGSRLGFLQTLALILLALTLNSVLLAAFAPIVIFFVITDSSYDFVKLLHVFVMGFSGFWAMTALWHGLREMCEKSN